MARALGAIASYNKRRKRSDDEGGCLFYVVLSIDNI